MIWARGGAEVVLELMTIKATPSPEIGVLRMSGHSLGSRGGDGGGGPGGGDGGGGGYGGGDSRGGGEGGGG